MATSAVNFFRSLGSAFGVAIFGAAAIEGMEHASFGVLGEPGPRGMDEGRDDGRTPVL
jgi:hypothetical protein